MGGSYYNRPKAYLLKGDHGIRGSRSPQSRARSPRPRLQSLEVEGRYRNPAPRLTCFMIISGGGGGGFYYQKERIDGN